LLKAPIITAVCEVPQFKDDICFLWKNSTRNQTTLSSSRVASASPETTYLFQFSEEFDNKATLLSSMTYLPNLCELSKWQYDFNLRRPGSFGEDRLFELDEDQVRSSTAISCKNHYFHDHVIHINYPPLQGIRDTLVDNKFAYELIRCDSLIANQTYHEFHHARISIVSEVLRKVSSELITNYSELKVDDRKWIDPISPKLYYLIANMLESIILPHFRIAHDISSLLTFLPFSNTIQSVPHTVFISNYEEENRIFSCNQVTELIHILDGVSLKTDDNLSCFIYPTSNPSFNHHFDVAVINTLYARYVGIQNTKFLENLCNLHGPPQYILMFSHCASAPTDYVIKYKSKYLAAYSLDQDLCTEGVKDSGGILLRSVYLLYD
jgi:hypothetical protein